jgi:adenosylhomocysteinase
MSEIRDIKLAPSGEKKIAWARRNMPVLGSIEKELSVTKPFKGLKIALSVHLEAKTACLCRVLQASGAEMHVTGSNPLSTQDDVAAALASGSGRDAPIDVSAWHGATPEEYERHLTEALSAGPDIVIDDGGDLVNLLHTKLTHLIPGVIGGCEETTTGVLRLQAMARDGQLKFPMITVNNARCKYMFDNRYGTGQSAWDAINRTTNLVVAGKEAVVAGYGWCGKGIAMRGKGLGARVIVTETDPVRALEAVMDGFDVMPMAEAAKRGDVFITATGCRDIITEKHFGLMKDGAILCNAGHFNVEVDVKYLETHAVRKEEAKVNIMGYTMPDGKTLFLIGEGRLVNLAAGDGHPVEIMDMSFAIQALSAKYIADHRGQLKPGVITVPEEVDTAVALRKLTATGFAIDMLSEDQKKYLNSWGNE